jgi:alcohol dehydrogenase (cytochrome c)
LDNQWKRIAGREARRRHQKERRTMTSQIKKYLGLGLAGLLLASVSAMPATAADMTHDRALAANKEANNWLLHHKDYQGHRFSALDQINTTNVKGMHLVFTVGLGGTESGGKYAFGNLEGTPIVEDGMMYVTDGWGSVYKIDVSGGKRGKILWRMNPGTDRAWAGDVACCGVNNRGVALWKDKIISIMLDGRMIAMKKDTGETVWERQVADPAVGETLTLAPLVIRDMAVVGAAGAEYGIRGWIDGTDLNTGKQVWRTYTIPVAGEPGGETWKAGDKTATHGGGSIWETGTYDPETDTMYWGTGNPGPDWDAEYRPGDNLWTDSVLAMDPATGKIKWGFQYTPNDPFDYDEIAEHPLIDVTIDGKMRKLVVHAARNGFFYALDRVTGEFVHGKQYSDQLNWTTGLDPKTGKPANYDPKKDVQQYADPSHRARTGKTVGLLCPTHYGAKNWEPTAYNPNLHLLYVGSFEGCDEITTKTQADFVANGGTVKPRELFTGGGLRYTQIMTGSIKAIDVTTGQVVAKHDTPLPNLSGTLATAGNLVFAGELDGTFGAYDAKSLQPLWSFNVGTGINAPAMTYAVNGKQYVAVLVGSRQPASILGQHPEMKATSTASMLAVFALD